MDKRSTLNLQENRDIWQVLNATFSFIGMNFKPLYKDVLLISAPVHILAGVFYSLSSFGRILGGFNSIYTSSRYGALQIFSPSYWLFLLCLLFGWALSASVIGNHVLQFKLHGKGYDVAEARRGIRKDLWRIFFAGFLNLLLVVAASLLFLIPGIYLAVANSLITSVLILDKRIDMIDAFAESRRLIRDNWWWAFLLGIVVSIIYYAFITVLRIPSSILSAVILFHTIQNGANNSGYYEILFIALNALSYLGYTLAAPITMVPSCIYYYSLKEKKDHVALMENINNIGVQPIQTQSETRNDEGDF